ncbi:hypothetical protein [Bradyrhizobium sp. 76]|uniref:hypothetical protein n=1 Tax=Bradyrhizobium sp. 76 TaxID=2782680 RepID=UPI001FFB6FF8|nr:hypothetical protein [Bradyrhizobium sp. 76]MCK1404907.1 hypothetical protein [Bradyrhizobium sp. 76]
MSQSNADRFKSKAEECRRLAAEAEGDGDKEGWLRLAAEWDKLAESAAAAGGIFNRYE